GADGNGLCLPNGGACLGVRAVGATAHRLHLRRGRIVGAGHAHEYLFDEPGARSARARRLGVLAHVVHRVELLLADRLDDRALAYAVAAADFHVVRHRGSAVLAEVPGVAEIRFSEHETVAQRGDTGRVSQELEVVRAGARVTVKHRADQPVVLQYELPVDAGHRIGERDVLGAFAAV